MTVCYFSRSRYTLLTSVLLVVLYSYKYLKILYNNGPFRRYGFYFSIATMGCFGGKYMLFAPEHPIIAI